MAKINQLPKYMADLIAAGEVVERPASVVKELLENAVDAGSDAVTVEIQRGGISYIRVSDNGCGIAAGEVKTAFLSHATSKIKNPSDLNNIMTLGFRGEALPSIAAVSRVNMITKTQEEKMGTGILIEGGEVISLSEAGCGEGTTVIVRDLFYNTPARMKFLKKDVSEGNFVAAVVEKTALCYPNIAFRFIRDGRQVFATNGDGDLKSVCFSAFGKDFSDGLLTVGGSVGSVSVSGLVTPPVNCRGSRGMQYFFVNGRSVKNATVTAALENAYKNSIMVGRFPGAVLFITLPAEAVDVNVHPAKTEVRFSDEKSVFNSVYHCVKEALNRDTALKQMQLTAPKPQKENPVLQRADNTPQSFEQTSVSEIKAYTDRVLKPISEMYLSDSGDDYGTSRQEDVIKIEFPVTQPKKAEPSKPQEAVNPAPQKSDLRLLGEIYKTYILIELDGSFCIIDKHAAHERIIFNKLKKETKANSAQLLIAPVTVSLSKEEYSAVLQNLPLLSEAGFEAEDFGNGSVLVRSCPLDLDSLEIQPLIGELAQYLIKNRSDLQNSHMDWIYHNVACRSAVKAGDENSPAELYKIAKTVVEDSDVRFCPHGRPVMIELTKKELEKQFGRV